MNQSRSPEIADDAPPLLAGDVIAIAQEWVALHAALWPGFAGAYLWGGITALPDDAPFARFRDVDLVVVLDGDDPGEEQEILYRGLSLEIIPRALAAHRDAEATLANPSAGPNLATTRILADPLGVLAPLRRAVAAEFGRRRWVRARCAAEQADAAESLAAMRRAATPAARLDAVRGMLMALSGLLAVAQLRRPTTRRTLALLHELLVPAGRADLHERALALMGSAGLGSAEVEGLLADAMAAFDRAVQVKRTPVPYGFAIQPHLRPYYLAGAREMIAQGLHREAMFWIACQDTAYLILANDAPPAEQPAFAARFERLCAALGYAADESWPARVADAEQLTEEIAALAASLGARHPE